MRAWQGIFGGAALWAGFMAMGVRGAANPHPDPRASFADLGAFDASLVPTPLAVDGLRAGAVDVLRANVTWSESGDRFSLTALEVEPSGTEALLAAASQPDPHGSFQAMLVDPQSGEALAHASVGTGAAYKRLVRGASFRFPLPDRPLRLIVRAEAEPSGEMATVLDQLIEPRMFTPSPVHDQIEVRSLVSASAAPRLIVNIYAEGYGRDGRERFFQDAARTAQTLVSQRFPMVAHFEMQAVFAPSRLALGAPRNLGQPVAERDSFLGLYYPYWHNFGRYYHVVYPTRELKYRRALGSLPYDYALTLVDDTTYWGVGNFKAVMAIPARNANFTYLLLHELGHYFGLNEEYEGGGATELAFAAKMREPWSQNITFQSSRERVKWQALISTDTAVPTPSRAWRAGRFGAYVGGYADTPKPGPVYKPGYACTMESGRTLCAICDAAIVERVRRDLGMMP